MPLKRGLWLDKIVGCLTRRGKSSLYTNLSSESREFLKSKAMALKLNDVIKCMSNCLHYYEHEEQ